MIGPISKPEQSQLQDTNEAIQAIFRFLFYENSFLTWIHLLILVAGSALLIWAGTLDPDRLTSKSKFTAFAKDVITGVKGGAATFLSGFFISFVAFCFGIALDRQPGLPSLLVQVLTYMPTLVLGLTQLRATHAGVQLVKKHTGL